MRQAAGRGKSAFLRDAHDRFLGFLEHGFCGVQPGVEDYVAYRFSVYGPESQSEKSFRDADMLRYGLYGYAIRIVIVNI